MGQRTGSRSWSYRGLMLSKPALCLILTFIQHPSQAFHHKDYLLHFDDPTLSILTFVTSLNTLSDSPRQVINPRRPVLVHISRFDKHNNSNTPINALLFVHVPLHSPRLPVRYPFPNQTETSNRISTNQEMYVLYDSLTKECNHDSSHCLYLMIIQENV